MDPREVESIIKQQGELFQSMEALYQEWIEVSIRAQVAGKLQVADIDLISAKISSCRLKMCNLHTATQEPLRRSIKKPLVEAGVLIQDDIPVAEDSSTSSTSPENMASKPEAQGKAKTKDSPPEILDQPTTSGVKEEEVNLRPMMGTSKININTFEISPSWQTYQSRWEKLNTRKGLNPAYCRVDGGGKYPRVWMLIGAKPQEVREWYDFGALASVYIMAPSFNEIKNLPKWINDEVFGVWANNNSLKRGDVLELYFISAAPEPPGKGNHNAFHFIKLRRPDLQSLNRIKENEGLSVVGTFTEERISFRRAWGLWVCLTEMEKVKYKFKYAHNSSMGSFLLNTMTGSSTGFAERHFENK